MKYIFGPKNKKLQCVADKCKNTRSEASTFCAMHLTRKHRYGTLDGNGDNLNTGHKINLKYENIKCLSKDCVNDVICKGLCRKHYRRWQNYGDYNLKEPS